MNADEFETTRLLVRKILEKPHEHAWPIQGLGMLRLYLSPKIRLHIWNPVAPYKVENVSELHNHPWNFASTIIVGALNNHVYTDDWPHRRGTLWCTGVIECGPKPAHKGPALGPTRKLVQTTQPVRLGETYLMKAETIHRTEAIPGTVTICNRRPLPDPDHATVCWPVGTEWVSAEPRDATTDEVYAFTRVALARMDAENEGRLL